MANDIGQKFVAVAQVLILAALLYVAWHVQDLRGSEPNQAMSRTTEWAQPGGKLERFQSFREGGESFQEYRDRHDAAVRALTGGH